MAGRTTQCDNCSRQSLMSVLNNFVSAVNAMDEKVMVPCRLRDMEVLTDNSISGASNEENNNMSVMPMSSGRGEDLYNHYGMINAIKSEILSGKSQHSSCESDNESDTSSDDGFEDGSTNAARKTAEAFRHHLQGLFGLLGQLTDTAKYLGEAYEDQVGTKKTRKFVI